MRGGHASAVIECHQGVLHVARATQQACSQVHARHAPEGVCCCNHRCPLARVRVRSAVTITGGPRPGSARARAVQVGHKGAVRRVQCGRQVAQEWRACWGSAGAVGVMGKLERGGSR